MPEGVGGRCPASSQSQPRDPAFSDRKEDRLPETKRLNFQLQLPGAQPRPPVQVKHLPKHPLYRQTQGEGRGAWCSTVFILFISVTVFCCLAFSFQFGWGVRWAKRGRRNPPPGDAGQAHGRAGVRVGSEGIFPLLLASFIQTCPFLAVFILCVCFW